MEKRKRGVKLTPEGLQVIQEARKRFEAMGHCDGRLSLEKIGEMAGLDPVTVRKVLSGKKKVDKRTIEILFETLGVDISEELYSAHTRENRQNLRGMPALLSFVGRDQELALLQTWSIGEKCQLITILGMGGLGKTSLAAKLIKSISGEFDYIIWKSIRSVPLLGSLIDDLVQFISDDQDSSEALTDTHQKILKLVDYLHRSRCLIILDNIDSLFCSNYRAGKFLSGYEAYGDLFKVVAEVDHQSCLLITTREKPKEIAFLEAEAIPVRTLRLEGLQTEPAREILKTKGLSGKTEDLNQLIHRYKGNVLALKMTSTLIKEVFDGHVAEFLAQDITVFGEIRTLIEQQYQRLVQLEKSLIVWLAINREPTTLNELCRDVRVFQSKPEIIEAIESLSRRSLVEKSGLYFSLQPVVVTHITLLIVDTACQEIIHRDFSLLNTHSLMKATSDDYIKEAQIRLIIYPILEQLEQVFRTKSALEQHLLGILDELRIQSTLGAGYLGGNIINLLIHLGTDLAGCNLSKIIIWQVDFRNIYLRATNFSYANFDRCSFTNTFGSIYSIAFAPDGERLAAGDSNGDIHVYDVAAGRLLHIFSGHCGWVTSLAFSPDGGLLASGGTDHAVRLWDVDSGQCLKILDQHTSEIWAVEFSPTGHLLASGSDDATIRLWDVASGDTCQILEGHSSWVLGVRFVADERPSPNSPAVAPQGCLVSCSDDHTVKIWDISTGRCDRTLGPVDSSLRSIAISPCNRVLAGGDEAARIHLWELGTGHYLGTFEGHDSRVFSVAFDAQGTWLASGAHDQTVKLWDLSKGLCRRTLRGHFSWVFSVAFSPRTNLLASGGHGQLVKLWQPETGRCLKTLQGYTNQVLCVAFSPDGRRLASGSRDRTLKLWHLETGQCRITCTGHDNWIHDVAFSPIDDTLVVSASGDATLKLWDARFGSVLRTLRGHQAAVLSVAFGDQGRQLVSGSEDHTIKLWDTTSGRLIKTLSGHQGAVWSVVWLAPLGLIASGSWDKTVRLWDIQTGDCLHVLEGHTSWVWAIAVSSDGQRLATAGPDQTIRIYAVATGQCLTILHTNTTWLKSICFVDEDRVIAASSHDNTIKLWQVERDRCIGQLQGHGGSVWSIQLAPDGQTLTSSSDDETIKLWHYPSRQCIQTLKSAQPYEQMNITGVTGLTEATLSTLMSLGAIQTPDGFAQESES